eukprot:scaffold21935_cov53-Attheya_sp.AAC.2
MATTTKEEASSPTVAIESVMLTSVIDAKENRDVAIVDIPGSFMQADMDELVHMKLEGKMAELLVRLDPKLYRKYVQVAKRMDRPICRTEKSIVRHSQGRTPILETPHSQAEGVGIRNQSV